MRPLPVVPALFSVCFLIGCESPPGSEPSLRQYLNSQFSLWMSGESSTIQTFESKIRLAKPPIRYDIRSIVPVGADGTVFPVEMSRPEGWEDWPFYRVNAVVEWESQAGTPVEKVATYVAAWNPIAGRWYVREE